MHATCRSCGAPIIWARTTGGKLIPVDPDPTDNGNVELVDGLDRPTAIVHAQPPLAAPPMRLPHFATCPDADGWRSPSTRH